MITPTLLETYKATCYEIIEPQIEIYIGKENKELSQFLISNNFTTWCFITAWNPYSTLLSDEENIALNLLLEHDLNEYVIYDAQGKDAQGIWPPEISFFVCNISQDKAIELGKKYQQNAIVYGEINATATLLVLV